MAVVESLEAALVPGPPGVSHHPLARPPAFLRGRVGSRVDDVRDAMTGGAVPTLEGFLMGAGTEAVSWG